MGGSCSTYGRRKRCAQDVGGGNQKERDHWRDHNIGRKIILRWIFRKWERAMGTGWSLVRIGTDGRSF
jgi:hypothetical protein